MNDFIRSADFEEVVGAPVPTARPASKRLRRLKLINPADWDGVPVPPQEWIVEGFVPARTVSLLTAEGSAGKSTLALQLAAARALSKAWLTTMPRPGRTLVLSAEDDEDEMHRRLDAIRLHYGASWADLNDVRLVDLVGADAVLGAANGGGTIVATPLFDCMITEIVSFRPDLVIVDALADAFAGDEIKRAQARQFIGLLKRPARQHGCAFLALAHPSLTGAANGTGSSGSTGWGNSVRSRMFLEKAKASDGTEPDANMRTLTVNKSNYGPAGITLTLKWNAGIYAPVTGPGSLDKRALDNRAGETFLELLRLFNAQGQRVGANTGTTYAPAKFAAHPNAGGIGKKHFETAMQRLLVAKKIRVETTGSPSRQRSRLVIAECEGEARS